jgi:hypothetical protein
MSDWSFVTISSITEMDGDCVGCWAKLVKGDVRMLTRTSAVIIRRMRKELVR